VELYLTPTYVFMAWCLVKHRVCHHDVVFSKKVKSWRKLLLALPLLDVYETQYACETTSNRRKAHIVAYMYNIAFIILPVLIPNSFSRKTKGEVTA